jgi:ribosome biogenesis protein BMS1
MPVYATEDHNRRLRALKYSPEHMHCMAALWGPYLPPGTGLVCTLHLVACLSGKLALWKKS